MTGQMKCQCTFNGATILFELDLIIREDGTVGTPRKLSLLTEEQVVLDLDYSHVDPNTDSCVYRVVSFHRLGGGGEDK